MVYWTLTTNGVNATNSASLTANIAGALIPGATGLGLAARAGNKGSDIVTNGARGRASEKRVLGDLVRVLKI